MHRRLFELLSLMVTLVVAVTPLWAQATNEPSEPKTKAPVFSYVLAILSTIVVLLIICRPSRKQQ